MSSKLYGYFMYYGFKYLLKVVWCVCCGALFWRTYLHFKYGLEYVYLHQILGGTLCYGRASAAVLNLNCAVILLPMCHTWGIIINKLLRKLHIQWVWVRWNANSFHIFIGYIVVLFSVIHIGSHAINIRNFCATAEDTNIGVHPYPNQHKVLSKLLFFTVTGVTGLCMVAIIVVIVLTSFQRVRRRFYNMFWYSHRLFFLFYACLIAHGFRGPLRKQENVDRHFPGCNGTSVTDDTRFLPEGGRNKTCQEEARFTYMGCETWTWLIGPLVIYMLDFSFRLLRRSARVTPSSVTVVTDDVVECQFEMQHFSCKPGQYVLLNCSSVSSLEWHPFTIVQVPNKLNNHSLKLLMRKTGDWTGEVGSLLSVGQHGGTVEDQPEKSYPEVRLDGPYSSPMEKIADYDVMLCVAGGVGITPFLAHINSWRERVQTISETRKVVYLIVSSRDERLLQYCLDAANTTISQTLFQRGVDLRLELYLTTRECSSKHFIFGRPEFEKIFKRIKEPCPRSVIGTFVCGPYSMCKAVKNNCLKESTVDTKFVFYKETF